MYSSALEIPLIPTPTSLEAGAGAWNGIDPVSSALVNLTKELKQQKYVLRIGSESIEIDAGSNEAALQAKNTLQQIADLCSSGEGTPVSIPALTIQDSPRFEWRGLHLDPSRHFLPLGEVKTIIDMMALYKLNVMHFHLTDDQGWRWEVKGYPRLTEIGAWRERTVIGYTADHGEENAEYLEERHGGYYTQDELRELVEYAHKQGITIVPEVDLPGHMQAAIAAYPEFGNHPEVQHKVRETWGISEHVLGVSDEAFTFVRDVLEQVCDIFDSRYIHIGGDEVPRVEWENNETVNAKLAQWGFSTPADVQRKYTEFAHEILAARGRIMVGWDEILESELPDDTVIMNWREAKRVAEALDRGLDVVVSTADALYFDFPQSSDLSEPISISRSRTALTLQKTYTHPLFPEGYTDEGHSRILGIQGQAWSEFIPNAEHLQYMLFPRVFALAERAWNPLPASYEQFAEKVAAHERILDNRNINYRPLSKG